jgi:signal transduction histidine kinase
MLHDLVVTHRDAILARAQKISRPRTGARAEGTASDETYLRVSAPTASPDALEDGLPMFLTQVAERLTARISSVPSAASAIGSSAARHGRSLLERGYSVSQVVHEYGELCQAITECAVEQQTPITTEGFHTLHGCLDTAIAEAVTEHARLVAERSVTGEVERLGRAAHEFRDLLNAAVLAFHALKHSQVTINGSAGMVLGRSLMSLRSMIDSTLSEVRLGAPRSWRERINVSEFIDAVTVVANLHAEYHDATLVVDTVSRDLVIHGDPQVLSSAVMNLVINGLKYTRHGGRVLLRARRKAARVLIEVEDECGGFPERTRDPFRPFGEQRSRERTGLGMGLSIARQGIRAHGGDILIRNIPGHGCVFAAEVPLAAADASAERKKA